jgi:hypothetical protein
MQWFIDYHIKFGKTPNEAEDWLRVFNEASIRFIGLPAHQARNTLEFSSSTRLNNTLRTK